MIRIGVTRTIAWATAAVLLAACGGGGGDNGGTTAPPAPPAVAAVTVALSATQLFPGGTASASVELRSNTGAALTGRAINWTSSSTAVAAVDQGGNVLAVAPGTATINATSEGVTGSATLTVAPAPVATVTVTIAQPTVTVGTATSASATLRDERGNALTGRAVTYSSSATSVATIDASGTIATIAPGSAIITATSEGKSGVAALTVLPPPVATVSVSLARSVIAPGATTSASAVLRDAQGAALTGRAVTWASSAPNVATVDAGGFITAIAPGTTSISATSEGKSGAAVLTVQLPPVASVTLSGSTRVKVGDTYTYTATARLADGTVVNRPVTWSTSDASRASFSQAGLLTPLQEGAFRIQVTIDGSLWDIAASAYDWLSLTSNGSLFASLDADIQITNQFGTSEYPQLVISCGTSGYFFVWVRVPSFITSSGAVAYSFDGATPVGQVWEELSPNFNTLWKPGSNGTIKAFALQIAASRQFGFAFTEFRGTAKATIFRVTGLSSRLSPIIAACPGNAVAAAASQLATMTASMSSPDAASSDLRSARRARAISAPAEAVGPTIQALEALRAESAQLTLRKR